MKPLKTFLVFILLGMAPTCFSHAQDKVVPLWPDSVPGALVSAGYIEQEVWKEGALSSISRVSVPTLSIYLPKEDNRSGTAVVICPGGGYSHLAIKKEGFKIGEWLSTLGISAFVLKYRMPSDEIMEDKTIGSLQDAQEAIRFVRRNADTWNLDPNKIGIMGFSAGGHVAATASTHYKDKVYASDTISARPDFSILIYPVISMQQGITHQESKNSLLGGNPSKKLVDSYSNEKQVTPQTPPTFLVHATDDFGVPVENSISYYKACKVNGVPVEMHLYEKGGHGFGMGKLGTSSMDWTMSCEKWLRMHDLIPANSE